MQQVIPDLTNQEYHSGPGVSASTIKTAAMRTPLHITGKPKAETEAMKLGTMAHMATFEPDLYMGTYAIFEGDRRTKAGKAEWESIMAEGLIPITEQQHDIAEGIAAAAHALPGIMELIKNESCLMEASGYYEDQGVYCRFRPDAWHQDHGIILDLKTCQDASPRGFANQVAAYGYHIQAAHYLEGAEKILQQDHRFIFIAVEKEAPFAAAAYELDEASLLEGLAMRNLGLQAIKTSTKTGVFPGYSPDLQSLTLPRWAFKVTDPNMILDQ